MADPEIEANVKALEKGRVDSAILLDRTKELNEAKKQIVELSSRESALRERVKDLEEVLDSIEWWTDPSLPDHRMCLVCDAYEEHGHKPDCKRQKLLHPVKKALKGLR